MHAKWEWNGSCYFSFGVVSLFARIAAVCIAFASPTLVNKYFRMPTNPVQIPHISIAFGWIELIWALVLFCSLLQHFSTSKTKNCKIVWSLRGFNRVCFGCYLIALGYYGLLSTPRFLSLLSLPSSSQSLFAAHVALTADPLSFLAHYSPFYSHRGIGPLLLSACFVQLLGCLNIVAGVFGLEQCMRAGEQTGAALAIAGVVLLLFGKISPPVLLVPVLDVLSMLGLYVYDLKKLHDREQEEEAKAHEE